MTEVNKKKQGKYYRTIIKELEDNLTILEFDKKRYGMFRRFVTGINRNIRIRKQQLRYYQDELSKAIEQGWAT